MSKRIFYRVPESCLDSYYELDTNWDIREDGEWAAQDAADDYHSFHDGWESSWPLEIALHDYEEGPELRRFSVECESQPVFSATELFDDANLRKAAKK